MDGFEGVKFTMGHDDGLQTRFAPIKYEEREKHIRQLVVGKRKEGYTLKEAMEVAETRNKTCIRPEFTMDELRAIVAPVFATPLIYTGLERNKAVLELVKVCQKRGQEDFIILSYLQIFNSRCCNPPLADDELKQIMESMTYTTIQLDYWQTDKEVGQDGKPFVRIGQTIDLANGGR